MEKARIFISYKRKNQEQVYSIVNKIESQLGVKCWVDLDGIESSAQFRSKICKAIDTAEVVLFMHSSAHLEINFDKDWTIKELNYAEAKEKRVVLLKLDDSPLDNIFLLDYGSKNNIDARDEMQFQKLLKDLRIWLALSPKAQRNNPEELHNYNQSSTTTGDIVTPTNADAIYSEACAASGSKRVMLLQKAADAGSRDAMYDLSDCYIDGEGVEQNEELAVKWLTRAADFDHPLAQTVLGGAYFLGHFGLEQNYVLSEKYLKMAADKNIPDAQAYLAQLYVYMEKYDQAMVWARKSTQASCPEAYSILGEIYLNGLGVESDPIEALTWYEKAAGKGDADAQNIIGNMYSNPKLNVLDLNKAFEYYQIAAAQNHMYGMLNLGLCYATGDGCEVDMLKAYEWIEKAANEGCPEAQEWLNNHPLEALAEDEVDLSEMTTDEKIEYTWNAFINNDLSKAKECVEILRKYANEGIPRAQCGLAQFYQFGFGVKQNFQQAAAWYKKSAEQGYAISQYHLGVKYEEGHGCSVNFQEAAKWYRKAALQGDPDAQFRLGLLYIDGNGVVMNKSKGLDLIQQASKQEHEDAMNWLENEGANLIINDDSNIVIENVWVDTDGVGKLFIHCDWVANNMKGECLQFITNLCAKSGKQLKYDWYYLEDKFKVRNDSCRFTNVGPIIPGIDFNMEHNEEKKIEFNIEIFKWGTDECIYSSKKMTFTVWYYFNFFSKNKFEIRLQRCKP